MACAAAMATFETYEEEGLLTRGAELSDYWQDAAHSLADLPLVKDIRNIGLIAGIELQPTPATPSKRVFTAFLKAYEAGLLIRTTGDTIALSPPLIIEKSQIDFAFSTLREIIKSRY
jgi:beta-alanine--pyruvate transaminase